MATAKTVTVNYTPEQTAELKAAYVAAPNSETVAAFAEKFGKSVKSIVAKLSREGVYQPKVYVSKTGEKPVKKDQHADAIGKVLRMSEPETESLTKATKPALLKIWTALANSVPREVESDADEAAKPELVEVLRRVAGLTDDEAKSLSRVTKATLAKLAAVFADEVEQRE